MSVLVPEDPGAARPRPVVRPCGTAARPGWALTPRLRPSLAPAEPLAASGRPLPPPSPEGPDPTRAGRRLASRELTAWQPGAGPGLRPLHPGHWGDAEGTRGRPGGPADRCPRRLRSSCPRLGGGAAEAAAQRGARRGAGTHEPEIKTRAEMQSGTFG
nr:uncharacterized protein LOC112920913 [Vulpes vulpes]